MRRGLEPAARSYRGWPVLLLCCAALLAGLAATLLGGLVYLNTPPALVSAAPTPDLPDDIDGYVAAAERQVTAQYSLRDDSGTRV